MRKQLASQPADYDTFAAGIRDLLDAARRASARAVNTLMTATYWEIGRRIAEREQGGQSKAGYGEQLIRQLSADLTARFGRGFGPVNLSQMKRFYLAWPPPAIFQTPSEKLPVTNSKVRTRSAQVIESTARIEGPVRSGVSRPER